MKYKKEDKVKIKNLDWYNENKNEDGDVPCKEYNFVESMSTFCGKILTIDVTFRDGTYIMKEDDEGYTFTNEMIEGLAEEKTKFETALSGRIYTKPNESYCYLTQEKDDVSTISTTYIKVNDLVTKIDNELHSGNQNVWKLPDGYQFVDENGNVINTTTIILEKKKPEFPKTYEECCKVMQVARPTIWFDYDDVSSISEEGDKYEVLIENTLCTFRKLLICRDAYWKIYGEEMGLGKPWEPNWDEQTDKFTISNKCNEIYLNNTAWYAQVLAFPTAKMRDAFYENFKNEIEECKELL